MKEGEDYYINENGLYVLTEAYHLKRGYCCENGCKHCPWNYGKTDEENHRKNKDICIFQVIISYANRRRNKFKV